MELLENIDSLIKAFESDDLKVHKGAVHYLRHDVILASLRKLRESYVTDGAETFIKNASAVFEMLNVYYNDVL